MKYEIIDEGVNGLRRIRSLKTFGIVNKGDLGGFVSNEENLSQRDSCWIYGDACVQDSARVWGNAIVGNNAVVKDKAQVYDNASVLGTACLAGGARVFGFARIKGEVTITHCLYAQQFKYSILAANTHAFIGCEAHTWEYWFKNIDTIAKEYKPYNEENVKITLELLRVLHKQVQMEINK